MIHINRVLVFAMLCCFVVACSGDKTSEPVSVHSPVEKGEVASNVQGGAGEAMVTTGGGCSELLLKRCVECHQLSRICQKLGKKNKKRWGRTIKRMIKRGAKLTSLEKDKIIDCLDQQDDSIVAECR